MNLVAIDKTAAQKIRIDFAFLDSGTGGLPYLLHLKEKSPHSNCVYVADTKNFPYGEKDTPRIIEAACSAAELTVKRFKPAAFVIGCNTISVTALEELRRRFFPVPFVGTVPAIKRAASLTKNGKIGLLATRRTIEELYTAELAERYAANCTLISRADPDLIDFVEHGFFTASDAEKEQAVRPALDFFLKHDADTVVLGCTHFLHIAPVPPPLPLPQKALPPIRIRALRPFLLPALPASMKPRTNCCVNGRAFYTAAYFKVEICGKTDYNKYISHLKSVLQFLVTTYIR